MRLTFATFLTLAVLASPAGRAEESTKAERGAAALSLLKMLDEGFVQVFAKVAPSVVVIEATKRADADDGGGPKGLEFFFDEHKDAAKPPTEGEKGQSWTLPAPPSRSEGSGFIIRTDGVILTNHHVVADAEKIRVRLKDGRVFSAKVVGADDKTDIAVLRIEAKDLPAVEMGDSAALRVGQLVCAIGAPFNQDYSFTVGWVSGKGRTNLLGPSSTTILYEDYIQTDAFINPGNSGGPLFDVEGKIVGMNTLINGVGRGLAFAIPAAMLADVSAQLLATGKVQRAWLGIRIETLGEGTRLRERPPGVEKGVIVETIEANAPASKSDLRPADVITEVDGVPVGTARELQREVLKAKIGQPVQLTVWRGGSARKIAVPTAELPATVTKLGSPPAKKPGEVKAEVFGLKLHDAQPAGAQIAEIAPGSAGSKAGLLAGDIIVEVAAKPVAGAAECGAAIASAAEGKSGKNVTLNVERHGKRTYVVLNPKN